MRGRQIFLSALALVTLVAAPALAEVYSLTLSNGATFTTRYRPSQSPNRPDTTQILTEFGNWIALPTSQIESITADTESKGYGTVLDTTTIAIGWAPNERSAPGEGSEADLDPTTRLLNYMAQRDAGRQQPDFSVEQFGEPSMVGEAPTGGVPGYFAGTVTPPLGRVYGEPAVARPRRRDARPPGP